MRLLSLVLVLLIAPPALAAEVPQSKPQQKCLAAFTKGAAKVAALVNKNATACLKKAAAGKEADAQNCLESDPKEKLGKFFGKFLNKDLKLCEATGPDFLTRLQEAPESRRHRMVLDFVRDRAVKIMGVGASNQIDPRQPLSELGLDSLMAVELRNLLAADLAVPWSLPATLLFDHPTIAAVAEYLAGELMPATQGAETIEASELLAGQTEADLEGLRQLSDEEASELLMRELSQAKQGTDPR